MKNIGWNEHAFWIVVYLASHVVLLPLVLLLMRLLGFEVDLGTALILTSIGAALGTTTLCIVGNRVDVPNPDEEK